MTPQNGKIKILIVEDDTPVAMMLTYLLAQAGIETEAATTGRKALQMAADGHFDLITLDADLPDVSGFEICRRLKENPFFQTPIVFVSGRLCPQDVRRGLELGAVDYITKPFETFEFAPRLLSHIKQTETVA
ncbi:MAG: response regulator transcription factor [Limisphaerales bacterium]